MSQTNNTAQRSSFHKRHPHSRDKGTHLLIQLIRPLRREGTRKSTLCQKARHPTVLPQGGIRRSTLPMIGGDTNGSECENEGRKRNVEKPRILMSPKHSPEEENYTPRSPPPSSVPLSTTPNEPVLQTTLHPQNPLPHAVHQTDRDCRPMRPSYHP